MLQRMPCFKRLRAAGAKTARLARTDVAPSVLFGVGVIGIGGVMLGEVRRLVRSTYQLKTAGRSLTLDLALEPGADPAYRCHTEPIFFFCVAVWDSWLPRHILARAVGAAIETSGNVASVWSNVFGAASALVATVQRIGWRLVSPFLWETHRGNLSILEVPPRTVGALAAEAVALWTWSGFVERNRIFPPFTPPLSSSPSCLC